MTQEPKYQIGDILIVHKTGAHFLLEDIDNYQYCFRVLCTGHTRKDTIFYIDSQPGITKVA